MVFMEQTCPCNSKSCKECVPRRLLNHYDNCRDKKMCKICVKLKRVINDAPEPNRSFWRNHFGIKNETETKREVEEAAMGLLAIKTRPFQFHTSRHRKLRCSTCTECTKEDCGSCQECLDKPKFGGQGIRKRACSSRGMCEK